MDISSFDKKPRDTTSDDSQTDFDANIDVNNESTRVFCEKSINHSTDLPVFSNLPADQEIIITKQSIFFLEPSNETSRQNTDANALAITNTVYPSQQDFQLCDELKYLLKPSNSLATTKIVVPESQEADATIKYRSMQFNEDISSHTNVSVSSDLKSQSITEECPSSADYSQHSTTMSQISHQTHVQSTESNTLIDSSAVHIIRHENRTFRDRLRGLIWSFLAAYALTIILFCTKYFEIDLFFVFFLQSLAQLIIIVIYACHKRYDLLGPKGQHMALFCRSSLTAFGTFAVFLAYYYATLSDISAIRQTQVVFFMILSIIFLREHVTVTRIISVILMVIATTILIRPLSLETLCNSILNSTDNETTPWMAYASSPCLHSIIGINLTVCTAATYSIASIIDKIFLRTQHLHYIILCFWSALFSSILSLVFIHVTHFDFHDRQLFPQDWRLFVAIDIASVSILIFIANQKAQETESYSFLTLINSSDIALSFVLQNFVVNIKSDILAISGYVLILLSVAIICIEALLHEKHTKPPLIIITYAPDVDDEDNNFQVSSPSTTSHQFLSVSTF